MTDALAELAFVPQEYDESVAIDAIEPHPLNPRHGDRSTISESIDANGFYGACVVQRSSGRIIVGNHRWMELRDKGAETVPVFWVDVDDETAERILLVDNRSNDKAAYHDQQLATLLDGIRKRQGDGGLVGTGYTGQDVGDLLRKLAPPSLDELATEAGNHDERGLWPVVRLRVSPKTFARWQQATATYDHDDSDELLCQVLDALEDAS